MIVARWPVFSPQTLGLMACVLAVLGIGWYLMQPANPDQLYQQIDAAIADGDTSSLNAAMPKIEEFLSRHPDDSRSERLRAVQEEVKNATPVQRAFGEAKRYTLINPELALTKFQALVDVYDDGEESSDATRHYVHFSSRQQQKILKRRLDQYVDDGRRLIESRLAKAAELSAQQPASARKIYQGIVELYGEKPWAANLVQQAKRRSSHSPTPKRLPNLRPSSRIDAVVGIELALFIRGDMASNSNPSRRTFLELTAGAIALGGAVKTSSAAQSSRESGSPAKPRTISRKSADMSVTGVENPA